MNDISNHCDKNTIKFDIKKQTTFLKISKISNLHPYFSRKPELKHIKQKDENIRKQEMQTV